MELIQIEKMILDYCYIGKTIKQIRERFSGCGAIGEILSKLESHGYIECCFYFDIDTEKELWYTTRYI